MANETNGNQFREDEIIILDQGDHYRSQAGACSYKREKDQLSISRLLKNTHLRRCPHPSSLRRTYMYASLLGISGALYLGIFEQPASRGFFSNLLAP